jgi:hypothetical protein
MVKSNRNNRGRGPNARVLRMEERRKERTAAAFLLPISSSVLN